MDQRRARWFAMDAYFLGGELGSAIRDRFGPVGIVLFVGFLAACKRAPVQGRITFTSDAEALVLMDLQGLELIDAEGEAFDLETFWTFLGHHKQTRRRARTRVQEVSATNWAKWQELFGKQSDADRKRRSREGNTPDDGPTTSGQIPSDAQPLPASDSDLDLDPDSDTASSSPSEFNRADVATPTTDDDAALRIVAEAAAERRMARQRSEGYTIGNPATWLPKTAASILTLLRERQTKRPDLSLDELGEWVEPSAQAARPTGKPADPLEQTAAAAQRNGALNEARVANPCPTCGGARFIEDEHGGVVPCETCDRTGVAPATTGRTT